MIPIINKLFEKNVYYQLMYYINNNKLFDIYRNAYYNTETALLDTMNYIYFSLDKNSCIQLVLLELLYTFDSISYDIIINRLSLKCIIRDDLKIVSLLIKNII